MRHDRAGCCSTPAGDRTGSSHSPTTGRTQISLSAYLKPIVWWPLALGSTAFRYVRPAHAGGPECGIADG